MKRLLAEGQQLFHRKDYKQAILLWQKVIKHPDATAQQRQAAEHCTNLLAPKLAIATRDTETFICPADEIDTMLVKAMVQPMEENHRVGEARDLVRSKQKTDKVLIAPLVPTADGPSGMPVEIAGLKRADKRPIGPDEASRTSIDDPDGTRPLAQPSAAHPAGNTAPAAKHAGAEPKRTESGNLLPPPRPVTSPVGVSTSSPNALPPNTVRGDSGSRRESEQLPLPPKRGPVVDDEDTHVQGFEPTAQRQPQDAATDEDVEDTCVGGDDEEDTRVGVDTGYKPAEGRLAGADRVTAIRDAKWAQQIRERLAAAIPPDTGKTTPASHEPSPDQVDLTPPQGSPAHVPSRAPEAPASPAHAQGEVVISNAHLQRMEDLIRQQGRVIERLHEEMAQVVRRLALVELEISASVSDQQTDTSRRLNPATGSSGRLRSISDTQMRALTPIKPELPAVSTGRINAVNGAKSPSGSQLAPYSGDTTRAPGADTPPRGQAAPAAALSSVRPITSEFALEAGATREATRDTDGMVVAVPADARRKGDRPVTTEPIAADQDAPADASFEGVLAAPVWPETTEVHLKGVSKAVDSIMEGVEQGAVPSQTAVHRLVRSVEVTDKPAAAVPPPPPPPPPRTSAPQNGDQQPRSMPPPPPPPPAAARPIDSTATPLPPPLTPTPPPPARSPAATLPAPATSGRRVGTRQPSHGHA